MRRPDRTNTAPVAGEALTATVTAGETVTVQSVFTDADEEDATLTYTSPAMSSDPAVATATVDAMGMVTIMGVAAGTATITVTATDAAGAYAMQTIMVTVTVATTMLQDIPDASISVTNNAGGSIDVNWMGGDNADRYIVVAAELGSDPFVYESTMVSDGMAKMAMVTGLNSGSSYLIIVIAVQDATTEPGSTLMFEYGVLQSVTAN